MNFESSDINRIFRNRLHTSMPQSLSKANLILASIFIVTILARVLSFKFIHLNYSTRDPDMWLVYELVDGKLLQGYTSIWHYFGLSAYSYPILFHSLAAVLHTALGIKFSELLWLNVVFSIIPPLFVYLTVRNYYGRNIALVSSFALATAPTYFFETLPGTFKARAMFYAIISAEIYFATKALDRPKKYLPAVVILAFLSALTYRASIPINVLILPCIVAFFSFKRTSFMLKILGVLITLFASVLFVSAYSAYTPSYGLIETLLSTAGKEGPLVLAGIFGVASSLRKKDELSFFPSMPAMIFLLVALFNWKAADALPILLSLYSGIGIIKLRDYLRLRNKMDWRHLALAVSLIGILTTSFGLTYYPDKWYIQANPKLFDEMAEIRQFISAQPVQKGSVIYGTTYTGFSLSGTYSSLYFIGPEQDAFVKAYVLNHLVSNNFDSWIIKHPESIYDDTFQLHNSIHAQNGQTLERFLDEYSVQYLVTERNASADQWAKLNRGLLAEVYSTAHYQVYNVTSTKPNIRLLEFIQNGLPENATILAPYYRDPFITQLRGTFLRNELNAISNFDYFILLEVRFLKTMDSGSRITDLKLKISMLEEAYSNASNLCKFASDNHFSYIIVDSETLRDGLSMMGLKEIFTEGGLHMFQAPTACPRIETGESPRQSTHTLVTSVFVAPAFSPDRYFLSGPARNASVIIRGRGNDVSISKTDATGTTSFTITAGEYTIEVEWEGYRVSYPITSASPYTFLPILLHPRLQEPMGPNFPLLISLIVVAFTLLGCFVVSHGKEE